MQEKPRFDSLAPLLGVKVPGSSEHVSVLTQEQQDALYAQFAPFIKKAEDILKNLGIDDDNPMVHLLKGDLEGEGHHKGYGQHGGNFVLLSNEIKGDEGSHGQGILWFKEDDYFTVSSTLRRPDGSGGCNFRLQIPFNGNGVSADFFTPSVENKGHTSRVEKDAEGIARVTVFEGTSIIDASGELVPELREFFNEIDDSDSKYLVVATPNIPLAQLEPLRKKLSSVSDGYQLDLDVCAHGLYHELASGSPGEIIDIWKLGWDDGRRYTIDLYTKEFFHSQPDARKIFDEKVAAPALKRSS